MAEQTVPNEQRRNDIRDEMLIDMARGIQLLLLLETGSYRDEAFRYPASPLTIIARLESHISWLKDAKK